MPSRICKFIVWLLTSIRKGSCKLDFPLLLAWMGSLSGFLPIISGSHQCTQQILFTKSTETFRDQQTVRGIYACVPVGDLECNTLTGRGTGCSTLATVSEISNVTFIAWNGCAEGEAFRNHTTSHPRSASRKLKLVKSRNKLAFKLMVKKRCICFQSPPMCSSSMVCIIGCLPGQHLLLSDILNIPSPDVGLAPSNSICDSRGVRWLQGSQPQCHLARLVSRAVDSAECQPGKVAALLVCAASDKNLVSDWTRRLLDCYIGIPRGPRQVDAEDGSALKHRRRLHLMNTEGMEPRLERYKKLYFADVERCPVTYIYDIPSMWDYRVPLSLLARKGRRAIWRRSCGDGTRNVNQYSMSLIIVFRLLTSRRCRVTKDPKEADLFLVPILPKPKSTWGFCQNHSGFELHDLLPHLDESNAHKHVLMLSKTHFSLTSCGTWWARPTGLLKRAIRVSYSMPFRQGNDVSTATFGPVNASTYGLSYLALHTHDFLLDKVPYPHTFSVPYPASGILGSKEGHTPWKEVASERPYLALFGGGLHGDYGLALRQKIVHECRKVGKNDCLLISTKVHKNTCKLFGAKKKAKFCLEPGGDTPVRKSMYDSISLGCIPVIFSPYVQLQSPWHWGHFYQQASVYINGTAFLENHIDLFYTLKQIAQNGELLEMQQTVAEHGHEVQYSQVDHPGDGFERLLVGAHRVSQQLQQRDMLKNDVYE